MSANLCLIAHKVRGERAFDVAEPLDVDGDVWWIIPTSGHRAYPYWTCSLPSVLGEDVGDPPEGLRDHYAVTHLEAAAKRPSVSPRTPTLEDI